MSSSYITEIAFANTAKDVSEEYHRRTFMYFQSEAIARQLMKAGDQQKIIYLDNEKTSAYWSGFQIHKHELMTNKNQANGYAGLDSGGKILTSLLPSLSITDVFVVNSQAAMLALTAERGDVAVRLDQNLSYILTANDPTVLGNWQELVDRPDLITSVAGRVGAIVLAQADINGLKITDSPTFVNLTASGLTASRALVSGSGGIIQISAATAAEVAFLSGVDSAIQTQINGKEPTITALPIAKGGSGQTSKAAAFDALSPVTTKGDLVVRNATSNTRLPAGANNTYLVPDSTLANGLKYRALDIDSQNAIAFGQTTTSLTSVPLCSIAATAGVGTKNYNVQFSGHFSNTLGTASITIEIYVNGVPAAFGLTQRNVRAQGANQNFCMATNISLSIPVGQSVEIWWSTSAGTAACSLGCLNIFGVA